MKNFLLLFLMFASLSSVVHSDIIWSPPSTISTVLTNASDPQVVIDNNGNITAAWIENSIIKAGSLPSGGSWSAPVTISNALNASSNPILGIDSSGNVTALWIENSQIESATLPFGGSWGAETSPISSTGAATPSLAVDASGNAVAVWTRNGFIESSTRISGSWSSATVRSASNSSNPCVAISNIGKAIAAWHSVISGADVIVTDILTISGNTWAATKNVFAGTAALLHNYPAITIDSNGNATVAWFRYNFSSSAYQNVQVLSSSLMAGAAAWTIPTILSSAGIRNPADLTIKLLVDANGDVLAVWTNSRDGETFSAESSKILEGGTWQGSILPHIPTLYTFGIDIALASGTVLLTTMSWDGISFIQIQSQLTDIENPVLQRWTEISVLSTANNNGYPANAMSITGSELNAAAVWIHFDGTNKVIQASTGSESLILAPSNVSAAQSVTNFGVYQDYFNTITWDASLQTDIIQYDIYRNGVFFTQTTPDVLQFVDHNAIQGGSVIYGVAALSSDFRQSPIISFTLNP